MNNSYSSLYPKIDEQTDPDDSFSEVPYEKGYQLLFYLESLIGKDHMKNLLRQHILNNTLTSINYDAFRNEFEYYVNLKFENSKEIIGKVDWYTWVHKPGLSPVSLNFKTPELITSEKLADEYIILGGKDSPVNASNYKNFFSNFKVIFHSRLSSR